MPKKAQKFVIRGMQRDLSASKFSSEFAFENKNIRISTLEDSTLLSLVNEKGTSLCDIKWVTSADDVEGSTDTAIYGIPIGKAVIDHKLILFTHNINDTTDCPDRIYKFWFENGDLKGMVLKRDNLSFNENFPIETLISYESATLQKVYWVDGYNQPRVLNVVGEHPQQAKIDFLPAFSRNLKVAVDKLHSGEGLFNSGTVQYVITYYEKYGQETNAVLTTPIYYISPIDRGGSPDETNTCSFKLKFTGIDTSYQYMRIYSVQKSSESGSSLAHIVADIKISGSEYTYVDTGIYNQTIDPTILMYLGGVEITASTLTQKDNTLFLGDLELKGDAFSESQIKSIQSYFSTQRDPSTGLITNPEILYFSTKESSYPKGDGVYIYENQLKYSSQVITTYKAGEYYRFGIQFMTNKGQWSQVFYIGDLQNTIYPKINVQNQTITTAKAVFKMEEALYNLLPAKTIVSCRLVYAEMSLADHTVIAQGALCPTLFNYKQRVNNQPFSLSSWFMRPDNDGHFNNQHLYNIQNKSISIDSEIQGFDPNNDEYRLDAKVSSTEEKNTVNSIAITIRIKRHKTWFYWVTNGHLAYKIYDGNGNILQQEDDIDFGANSHSSIYSSIYSYLTELLTYPRLSGNYSTKEEKETLKSALVLHKEDLEGVLSWGLFQNWFPNKKERYDTSHTLGENGIIQLDGLTFATEKNAANYFVDRSIVTFHSPELATMQDRINNSNLKFRIVGLSDITASESQYIISAKNTTVLLPDGADTMQYKFEYNNQSIGASVLKTFPLWFDGKWEQQSDESYRCSGATTIYPIYPWQASGSLNGHPDDTGTQEYANKSSVLEHKVLANLKFSLYTKYVGNDSISSAYTVDISKPQVVDSDNITITKINDSRINSIVYNGNYDYLLMHNAKYHVFNIGDTSSVLTKEAAASALQDIDISAKVPESFGSIRIKFKSTSHAVFKFDYITDTTSDGTEYQKDVILPLGVDVPYSDGESKIYTELPWDRSRKNYAIYDKASEDSTWLTDQEYPYIWIGELYIDREPSSWLGGFGDNALESNKWIPAGDAIAIPESDGSTYNELYAYGTEGDTYFQRWDCLKTYPYSENDENSIIDVTSFMVETYTNIDGRYDKNRGTGSLLYNRPTNFNLLNRGYTQGNNVFNYSVLDEKFNLNIFKNQITWSKTKTASEDVDTWTNLTLASILEMDGDKGKITKLTRWNNNLLCFQESGISEIQFNNLTAMSTQEGVPLEIANSGKVNGKAYISSSIGCTNKWSICQGANGLYFMDDLKRKIMLLSGEGLKSISDSLGFSSWAYQNISGAYNTWLPNEATDFTAQYDNNTSDVYFINKDTCLAYNENLGQFTSFYSYQGTLFTANLDEYCLAIAPNKDNQQVNNSIYKIWKLHDGDYNYYFGAYDDFYTTVIANQDPESDKIYDTLEFRSDTWNSAGELLPHKTFDKLSVWNEYQKGNSKLNFQWNRPSNLKHKFRIWRANIPRSDTNNLDRIRNPWAYIKLCMENPNTNKTILHDLILYYFL